MRKISYKSNAFYKVLLIYFLLQTSILMLYFVNDSINTKALREAVPWDNVLLFRGLMFITIIATNIFIIYLLKKLYQYINTSEKARIESAKHAYLEGELKIYRKHRHDMKNHLLIIYELAKNQKYEDLKKYLTTYYKEINTALLNIETGVDELDMLFATKFGKYKENDISLTFNCSTRLCIHDNYLLDFVSLFSNILDNAMEASIKVPNRENRMISVNITEDKLDYMFVVTNSTLPMSSVKKFRAEGFTTKRKKGPHGLGLSIIENLVAKYKGTLNIEILNNRFFQVKIEIPKHMVYPHK